MFVQFPWFSFIELWINKEILQLQRRINLGLTARCVVGDDFTGVSISYKNTNKALTYVIKQDLGL